MGGARPNSSETVHLTIPSRLEELAQVHALLEELGQRHGMDEDYVNSLLIAVIEAGTNAVQHGNMFADDKVVKFEVTVDPGNVHVRVDDLGHGFDPSRVLNPTEGEQLLSPHGRGLFLMRQLMDEVKFETGPEHGTTVFLRKAR
ncbi:MAG TPA: ATP-binding protein [Candidatus Eisenbacteria bacterium]|jgi:serine/threonine-protein kinase RsbW|nr:ATP-binding protein [Candidatus Eisenbacteria bacterium]HZV91484.1 ATP-binding protein [Candidatus Nitrosocosmicus sp.]